MVKASLRREPEAEQRRDRFRWGEEGEGPLCAGRGPARSASPGHRGYRIDPHRDDRRAAMVLADQGADVGASALTTASLIKFL